MEENEMCSSCSGSGEGGFSDTTCMTCGGSGANICEECDYCDGYVNKKYRGVYVHKECYGAARAESMGEI